MTLADIVKMKIFFSFFTELIVNQFHFANLPQGPYPVGGGNLFLHKKEHIYLTLQQEKITIMC